MSPAADSLLSQKVARCFMAVEKDGLGGRSGHNGGVLADRTLLINPIETQIFVDHGNETRSALSGDAEYRMPASGWIIGTFEFQLHEVGPTCAGFALYDMANLWPSRSQYSSLFAFLSRSNATLGVHRRVRRGASV